ncbi:response regulator transcription factor [Dickeya sp. CFBP 2040]|uniref:response regulator transcription factor n=1 Tax=Dickeya sp. CFBP 2040 TaxID=2718531 RepID=UPI001447D7ED|nr:response regulator transcription factor [Dickeya sp. CFBP 2040]NKI73928.1 response regulator transcription factor [Dickeya sp. CFBP 2040]
MNETSLHENTPLVYIVDDDASVRAALEDLLASVGLESRAFESPQQFINAPRPDRPGCLILDVRMPGMSGLDFQDDMHRHGIMLPVIFITAHGDIPMSVRAMKAGALEFLTKPFREQGLLDAIQKGLERDNEQRRQADIQARLQACYDSLTTGEQQVLEQVVTGQLNKQIAAQLGVSEITVKVRRAAVMRKMNADSLAELVRLYDALRKTAQG